ncbi:MAG: hypothetical protein MUQ00_05890 [Candidatus Aminicenantes bacterium]|nr:hypothetical protein [Candidatus Aminicenantes bacterium]
MRKSDVHARSDGIVLRVDGHDFLKRKGGQPALDRAGIKTVEDDLDAVLKEHKFEL